jgi:hypothetical protein
MGRNDDDRPKGTGSRERMSAKKKPKVVSIREHLTTSRHPFLVERIIEGCKEQGIDLDSPWPPPFKKDIPAESAQLIQLPLWPEPTRGTPNAFLRSNLFAATDKGRSRLEKAQLKTLAGYEIKYTGTQLTQAELAVWELLVHLARRHPLENECMFTGNAFFKALGYKKRPGNGDYEWLDTTITRFTACAVEVRINEHQAYVGGLIDWYLRDDNTRVFKIKLNAGMLALYGRGQWTQIQWQQRRALRGKPLALWLHGFYSSHAAPYPITAGKLRELSGSNIKDPYKFKQSLKKALTEIEAAGVIAAWHIAPDTNMVTVENIPTRAQTKHLVGKQVKRLK